MTSSAKYWIRTGIWHLLGISYITRGIETAPMYHIYWQEDAFAHIMFNFIYVIKIEHTVLGHNHIVMDTTKCWKIPLIDHCLRFDELALFRIFGPFVCRGFLQRVLWNIVANANHIDKIVWWLKYDKKNSEMEVAPLYKLFVLFDYLQLWSKKAMPLHIIWFIGFCAKSWTDSTRWTVWWYPLECYDC